MDTPINTSETFVLMDERYKKLEYSIKMMQKKHFNRKNAESHALDMAPNISSIHSDALDSSCTFSSKLGSEVVSSSANMRKMMSHKLINPHINENIHTNINTIATSSVKADDETRAIMPPPKSIGILAHSSRRNSFAAGASINSNFNKKSILKDRERNYSPPNPSIISSIKYPSSVQGSAAFTRNNNPDNDANALRISNTPDRIFVQWKVQLNDEGQLIIKGLLKDYAKPVRSKPVIRRLSAVMVQSCFNHIYELQGRIYDDKDELPDYIRGKFYNGFPDDWENVYQVWRSFVASGCKSKFRWPTPITDSDDDLKSDITDSSYRQERRSRPKSHLKSQNEYNNSEDVDASVDAYEKSAKKVSKTYRLERAQSPIKTIENRSTLLNIEQYGNNYENEEITDDKSDNLLVMKNKSQINIEIQNNNSSEQRAMNSFFDKIINEQQLDNSATVQTDIDEDTSSAVFKILTSKNLSIEYIDKVIEMFNCYKYVITSKPQPENSSLISENQTSEASVSNSNHKHIQAWNSSDSKHTTSRNSLSNKQNSPKSCKYNQTLRKPNESMSAKTENTHCDTALKSNQKIRRKLTSRDYSSNSEMSETDIDDERCRKNFNMSHKSSDTRMSATGKNTRFVRSEKRNILKRNYDDSDDTSNDIKEKVITDENSRIGVQVKHQTQPNLPENHRLRKDINHQVDIVKNDSEIFKRPVSTIRNKMSRHGYSSENMRLSLSNSRKIHGHFKDAGTLSTIAGFLENYDSCVSISEDDRGITENCRKNWPKFDDSGINESKKSNQSMNKISSQALSKRTRHSTRNYADDSSVSFTEDEVHEAPNKKIVKPDPEKLQVLQEFNAQSRFQQLLKQDLQNNSGNFVNYKKTDDKRSFQSQNKNVDQKIYQNEGRRLTLKSDVEHPSINQAHNSKLNFNDNNKENNKINESGRNSRCDVYENNEKFVNQDSCVNQQVQEEPKNTSSPKKEHNKLQERVRPEQHYNKNKPTIVNIEKTNYNLQRFLERAKNANKKSVSDETDKFTTENTPRKRTQQDEKSNLETPDFVDNPEGNFNSLNSANKNERNGVNNVDDSSKCNSIKKCKPFSIVTQDIGKNIKEAGTYGSEWNPKQLTNWVPKVIQQSNSKYGLMFEGKLINEVGHVINKKFTTDLVLRRISLKVIETVSKEFYQLVGDLHDIKYTVPKDVQKMCLNGCPVRIDKFCDKWREKVFEDIHLEQPDQSLNSTIDIMNIPHSSRGRRRLPPLCYWTGERLSVKDHQTFYNPGSIKNSFSDPLEYSGKDLSQNSSKGKNTSSNKNSTVSSKRTSPKNNISPETNEKDTRHTSNKKIVRGNQLNSHEKLEKKKVVEKPKLPTNKIPSPKSRLVGTRRSLRGRRLVKQQIVANYSSSDEEQPPVSKKRRRVNDDRNNAKVEKQTSNDNNVNNNSNNDKRELQMRSSTRRNFIERKRAQNNEIGEFDGITGYTKKASNNRAADELTNDDLSSI